MDTNDTITTLAHEIGHQVDRSGGESSADRTSEIMNRAWSRENKYEGTSGYTDTSKSHHLFYELSKGSQTVQQGTQTLENIKHGEAFAPPVIAGAIGGVAGAAGAGWGAYRSGAGLKGIVIATGIGATIGAASGALFQTQGVLKGVLVGASAGGATGALLVPITKDNPTQKDMLSGALSGAVTGGLSGGIVGPIVKAGGGSIAAQVAASELGISVDLIGTEMTAKRVPKEKPKPFEFMMPKRLPGIVPPKPQPNPSRVVVPVNNSKEATN